MMFAHIHSTKEKLYGLFILDVQLDFTIGEENVWDKNPVTYPDIQELIDFALDCTRLILGALTGVSRAVSYGNIDDMEGTLMLAKLGLKYQDYEMEQRHKQIVKEIYADKRSERNGKF